MDVSQNYRGAWDDLRKRIRIFWIVVLGYMPGVGLCTYLVYTFGLPHWIAQGVAFVWMAAFIGAGGYRCGFRCPQCHHLFFMTWWRHNPYAGKCLHCKLPRWSEPAAAGGA